MITEYQASEFISMVILNEKHNSKNSIEISFAEIYKLARELERINSSVRVNLSSDSLQSFFARIPKTIYVKNNILYVNDINEVYYFLRYYAHEETYKNLKEM